MSDRDALPDDVHIIREVHLNYGLSGPLCAPLTDSDAVAEFLRGVVSDTTREHAVAIYLDPKNRPLGWRIVSIGTDVSAPVKPLLVLQPAVLLGANAMIFAHNHPSGDLEPSPEDLELGGDALLRQQAAGSSTSRQHHLDRVREHELRALRSIAQGGVRGRTSDRARCSTNPTNPSAGTACTPNPFRECSALHC